MKQFQFTHILLLMSFLLITSCAEITPQIYQTPNVESFLTTYDESEFIILLAYGGSGFNSISDPIIENDDGKVRIRFTNKKAKRMDVQALHTSFRSFAADRQVSAIIKISDKVDSVSYLYDGHWKQVWPSLE